MHLQGARLRVVVEDAEAVEDGGGFPKHLVYGF